MYAVEDLALTGTTDGFVMRVTPLGFVQWISYINTNQNQNDIIVGAISIGSGTDQNIYGFYHSSHANV